MKDWIGLALLGFTLWLLADVYGHWRRVSAAWAAQPHGTSKPDDASLDPRSLAAFGEMVLPIMLAGLALAAFGCILLYSTADATSPLSPFDLAAMLAALVAYGLHFSVKIKCRMPKPAKTDSHEQDEHQRQPWYVYRETRLRQPYTAAVATTPYTYQQNRLTSGQTHQPAEAALEHMS